MAEDYQFPIEFHVCPNCGCEETLTRLACREAKEKGTLPVDAFVSGQKVLTRLMGSGGPLGITVPALLRHYDTCARCGLDYCTRAEKIDMPITGMKQTGSGGAAGFNPQGPWPAR